MEIATNYMLMIKPGALFGGSSLVRSLVVLKGKLKRCIHPISRSKFLKLPSAWSRQPEDDAEIPSGRSLATIFNRSVPRLVGDSHPFFFHV